jgi:hypothetical protein
MITAHLTKFKASAVLVNELETLVYSDSDFDDEGRLDEASQELWYQAAKIAELVETSDEPGGLGLEDIDATIAICLFLDTQDRNGCFNECAVATVLGAEYGDGLPLTYREALESAFNILKG